MKQKEDFTEQLSIALVRQFDCIVVTMPAAGDDETKNKGNKALKTQKNNQNTPVLQNIEEKFTLSDWNRLLLKLK